MGIKRAVIARYIIIKRSAHECPLAAISAVIVNENPPCIILSIPPYRYGYT